MPGYIEQRDGYGWTTTVNHTVTADEYGARVMIDSDDYLQKTVYIAKAAGAPVYVRKVIRVYEKSGTETTLSYYTTGFVTEEYGSVGANITKVLAASASHDFVFEGYAISDVAIFFKSSADARLYIYPMEEAGY